MNTPMNLSRREVIRAGLAALGVAMLPPVVEAAAVGVASTPLAVPPPVASAGVSWDRSDATPLEDFRAAAEAIRTAPAIHTRYMDIGEDLYNHLFGQHGVGMAELERMALQYFGARVRVLPR